MYYSERGNGALQESDEFRQRIITARWRSTPNLGSTRVSLFLTSKDQLSSRKYPDTLSVRLPKRILMLAISCVSKFMVTTEDRRSLKRSGRGPRWWSSTAGASLATQR